METIYKIDAALIVVSLVVLMGTVILVGNGGYTNPLVISPVDDYETSETEILFTIGEADVLLIDDNTDFTIPEEYFIKDGLKINLKPGKYYWKSVGEIEIRTLTIVEEINLMLDFDGEGYSVTNIGNVRLNVDVYDNNDELIEKVKVGISDSVAVEGDKFVGGQDE